MNSGHLSRQKRLKHGSGLRSVERHEKLVAYAIGGRSEATCRELWNRIPGDYQKGYCYTDFWRAYQAVIPEEQHRAIGKETGETSHVERWNNTLRLSVLAGEQMSFAHLIPPPRMRKRRW